MKKLSKNSVQLILIITIFVAILINIGTIKRDVQTSMAVFKVEGKKQHGKGLLVGKSNRKLKYVITGEKLDKNKKIQVMIPNKSGQLKKEIPAKILSYDKKSGLTLLELSKKVSQHKALSFNTTTKNNAKNLSQLIHSKDKNLYEFNKKPLKSKADIPHEFVPILTDKDQVVGIYLNSKDTYVKSTQIVKFLADNQVNVRVNDQQKEEVLLSGVAALNILIIYTLLHFRRKKQLTKKNT